MTLMSRPIALVTALSCLLAGCSGLKTYRSDNQKNLYINTQTDARGWFSGVDAALDIYRIQGDCEFDYQGTVELGNSRVEVGVPAGEPAYLAFRFESSAFLANSHSSMSYDVTLNPLVGHVYDIGVTYRDNIYNVEVQERMPGETESKPMILNSRDRDCNDLS